VDPWCELRGGDDAGGWTYDVVANPMLRGRKPERKRPDRFLCYLKDFTLDSIEIIGVDAIPGVTYTDDKGGVVPVLPSHQFGLVLTISPKKN
jgi:tyrosyl-DNA phosphodiesterase 2